MKYKLVLICMLTPVLFLGAQPVQKKQPTARLIPSEKFFFKSFVDCNMASVWIGDTFRIFPGKYGEDPLWGDSRELKYASGTTVDEVFSSDQSAFAEPVLPVNAKAGTPGLHGAVWFETMYQYPGDVSGKTLFALYHNENYPSTLPYDALTGSGYMDKNWPEGLRGPETKTAVCRIGIMKSVDGGRSWSDKGIILEDLQPRLILRPHNTGINFAGGVGDPSAVSNGKYLFIFYGEYGYPGIYDGKLYDSAKEWKGQCISVARILLSDLDNPEGKTKRWDGKKFDAAGNGIGIPVIQIQIPMTKGGGPASSPYAKYFWGPSVSWNQYLGSWVMLMAKAEGPSWKGNSIYISYNQHADLSTGDNAQDWSVPRLLLKKPGHTLWYPSLQPINSIKDKKEGYTSLRLPKKARLFFKDMEGDKADYISEYLLEFE